MARIPLVRKLLCGFNMRDALTRALIPGATLLAMALSAGDAQAHGSLSGGGHRPIEQRIAVSLGPARTTVWTQLRVTAVQGPLAVVVPVEPGAALDWSSPAWFEALEGATAPRIFPPEGVSGVCPGEDPSQAVHVAGDLYHQDPLTPLETSVLLDADAVVGWAEQNNLAVSGQLWTAMGALAGHRFVVVRFSAPDGESVTPTLRISGPSASAALPLVLSSATTEDLLVTTFVLGEGSASLDGPVAQLPLAALSFDAAAVESNYRTLRSNALRGDAWLREAASRAALAYDLDVGDDTVIAGALGTYFERAALYAGGAIDPAPCVAEATAALGRPGDIAEACPRADLGVVEGTPSCNETVPSGAIDPARLRCGSLIDDLAVALSGQTAKDAWLSRVSFAVTAGGLGSWRNVALSPSAELDPVLRATSLDVSGCPGEGSTITVGASSSAAGGGPTTVNVPVYAVESGCGAREVGEALYVIAVTLESDETAPDAYYQEEDSCSGDTSDTYTPIYYEETGSESGYESDTYDSNGDCSGDTTETYDDGGDCSSDTSDTYDDEADCSSDTSGGRDDSCSSDTTGSSSSDADCGSDTSSSSSQSGCGDSSSGSDGGCSVAPRRRPRLSFLVLLATALAVPMRRVTRPRRPKRSGPQAVLNREPRSRR